MRYPDELQELNSYLCYHNINFHTRLFFPAPPVTASSENPASFCVKVAPIIYPITINSYSCLLRFNI